MRVAPPTRDVLPVRTDTPCHARRFPPLRANTLAPPITPARPFSRTLCVRRNTQRNSGAFPAVAPGMVHTVPLPVGRSTIRAMRCSSGTRTNSAGRQCPGRRYGLPPACASTSWTCRRRRGTRRCGTWGPGLRWRFTEGTARVGSGCGSWWPRGARTSCRGCSTGWSGAPSRWISGRSVRAGASRLHRHLLFDRRECPRIHRVRVVHGGPVRKRPVHGGRV